MEEIYFKGDFRNIITLTFSSIECIYFNFTIEQKKGRAIFSNICLSYINIQVNLSLFASQRKVM